MTNLPKVGEQIAVTNTDGSVTVSVVTEVGRTWGVSLTPLGWLILIVTGIAITLAVVFFSKKSNAEVNKRFFQFIAFLFWIIGAAVFALGFLDDSVKGGPGIITLSMLGAWILFLGVLIFVWGSKRSKVK